MQITTAVWTVGTTLSNNFLSYNSTTKFGGIFEKHVSIKVTTYNNNKN